MSSKQTTKNHTVTHQTQGPEEWVQNEGEDIYRDFKNSMPKTYKKYTGERVADYGADYYTARDNIRELDAAGTPDLDKYSGVLDELYGMDSSYLKGSMQDRMNPYTGAVLDPTLRAINEARMTQLNEENASATMAGAFGDPQAGIARSLSNDKFNQATSDATNRAYSDAWDKAQGQTNVAMARLGQTGQGFAAVDQAKFNRETQLSKFLTQFGMADQQRQQALNDVKYNDWYLSKGGMNGYATQRYGQIMAMLNQTPADQVMDGVSDSTQVTKTPMGGQLFQMLGKLAGAAIGGAMGGPAGASMGAGLFGSGGGGGGGEQGGSQGASPFIPMQANSSGQFEWPTGGQYGSFNPAGYVGV